ncbi:MAG: DUF4143 domain-containing protein [Planctomycetota bacterium]
MYTRALPLPDRSFFVLGPRGTGKTTWLRQVLPSGQWYDLIRDREVLRLTRDPGVFAREVQALAGGWVVLDEVQRLPSLLNEIQSLIAEHGSRYRFAVSGSSARKLRRGGVNLLPARLINRQFFPLTTAEMGFDFQLDELLKYGCLPAVCSESTAAHRIDILEAYVENYIAQEIRIEAAVKNLEPFARFVEVAALMNAQLTNMAGIARDAAVARPTVHGYFDVLVDTLVAVWLPAWRPRIKVKEVAHRKFYFFDPGVVRALAGRLREPLEAEERGRLLETLVLHELRAWMHLAGTGGDLFFWRTPHGTEVDFMWVRARHAVGIEVKASMRWRKEDGRALKALAGTKDVKRAFGVYLGDRTLRDDMIQVLPVKTFLRHLNAGEILPA